MDFTDTNQARLKNIYPLPDIDRLINGSLGYRALNFMDVYFGYNQIKMHLVDASITNFMINNYNYYYEIMLFVLKNVGSTYQRLMTIVFRDQIGRNLEVSIDDIVVKTPKRENHYNDLK